MRTSRNSNRHTAINNLLSGLAAVLATQNTAAPAATKGSTSQPGLDPAKVSAFMAATTDLRTPGEVPTISGKWMVAKSPFKWADAQDRVAEVKAMGFKSCFVKGNRIGVATKDLAKAA